VPLWRETADALRGLRSMATSADQQHVFLNRHDHRINRLDELLPWSWQPTEAMCSGRTLTLGTSPPWPHRQAHKNPRYAPNDVLIQHHGVRASNPVMSRPSARRSVVANSCLAPQNSCNCDVHRSSVEVVVQSPSNRCGPARHKRPTGSADDPKTQLYTHGTAVADSFFANSGSGWSRRW
jgi:hypothetical protein